MPPSGSGRQLQAVAEASEHIPDRLSDVERAVASSCRGRPPRPNAPPSTPPASANGEPNLGGRLGIGRAIAGLRAAMGEHRSESCAAPVESRRRAGRLVGAFRAPSGTGSKYVAFRALSADTPRCPQKPGEHAVRKASAVNATTATATPTPSPKSWSACRPQI